MSWDRRHFLAAGGAFLASCRTASPGCRGEHALESVLEVQAAAPPETAGFGVNHYPMAAEALEAMGRLDAVPIAWRRRRGNHSIASPRLETPAIEGLALGARHHFENWRWRFEEELREAPWQAVLQQWLGRLAPGIVAAVFHGLLRTAHAVRALQRHDSPARRRELAIGLAYWAANYTELRPTGHVVPTDAALPAFLGEVLCPSGADEVGFDAVGARILTAKMIPAVAPWGEVPPAAALSALVGAAATCYLELFVAERHRIWLLHAITGPAAVGLLLPLVDEGVGQRLVAHARQAAVAMLAAFGGPFVPGAHVLRDGGDWADLLPQAAASGSVHTIKLIEALHRFDAGDEPLLRTIATRWLQWK